jgi:voltage-gated potassium channel
VRISLGGLLLVFLAGTAGYVAFGFSLLDAAYQTVTTVTTVGFREVEEFGAGEKVFTMGLILVGASLVFYTFTLVVEVVIGGQLREIVGRRRMDKHIAHMHGHVIVCGWGRVGRVVAEDLRQAGLEVVVIDSDIGRLADCHLPSIAGDATHDEVLRGAGIMRAKALVAALSGDAENLFVTLSARELRPELFIVARARSDDSIGKLQRGGADRVVNPQELGGARMASFVVRPHVAEFVDVVMHERSMEFRLQEVEVGEGSVVAGTSLRDANLRERTGALVLALRAPDGSFTTNPDPSTVICPGQVLIAVGDDATLRRLVELVGR